MPALTLLEGLRVPNARAASEVAASSVFPATVTFFSSGGALAAQTATRAGRRAAIYTSATFLAVRHWVLIGYGYCVRGIPIAASFTLRIAAYASGQFEVRPRLIGSVGIMGVGMSILLLSFAAG